METGIVYHMDKQHSTKAICNKSSSKYILFVKKNTASRKRNFSVVDENKNVLYTLKSDALTFGYYCMRLFNNNEYEIGNVKLTSKSPTQNIELVLENKTVGKISINNSLKTKYNLNLKKWEMDSDFFNNTFYVTDKN